VHLLGLLEHLDDLADGHVRVRRVPREMLHHILLDVLGHEVVHEGLRVSVEEVVERFPRALGRALPLHEELQLSLVVPPVRDDLVDGPLVHLAVRLRFLPCLLEMPQLERRAHGVLIVPVFLQLGSVHLLFVAVLQQ
jgi:hypothetical protein